MAFAHSQMIQSLQTRIDSLDTASQQEAKQTINYLFDLARQMGKTKGAEQGQAVKMAAETLDKIIKGNHPNAHVMTAYQEISNERKTSSSTPSQNKKT